MAAPNPPKNSGKDKPAPPVKKTDDEIALEELKKKLGHTHLMKADSGTLKALTERVVKSLRPTRDTWLTEWGGKGLGSQIFDLSALLDIASPLGNTVRWYARSLFHGGREIGLPGAQAAVAGSLVLVLGPGLTEKPRTAGTEQFFPTVEGGRLLTETMAVANDHDELTTIFASLSRNAAKAYVRTLEVIVERELSVTAWTTATDDEPLYTRMVLEEARDDLAWLSRTPSTVTYETEIVGVFRAVDDRNEGRFVIEPEPEGEAEAKPEALTGFIAPDLRHQPLSTRSRVRAVIRVTEAEESWLPKAPQTRHVLLSFKSAPHR